jgi:hypothetical protein
MLSNLRATVSDHLFLRSVRRDRSRVGWKEAPRYRQYLEQCQREHPMPVPDDPVIADAVGHFERDMVASIASEEGERLAREMAAALDAREAAGETLWMPRSDGDSNADYTGDLWRDFPQIEKLIRGPIGQFLQGRYRTHFKIFSARLYESVNDPGGALGSALWHSDSGPGICTNIMYYLDETTLQDGPLKALSWQDSLRLYTGERKHVRRQLAEIVAPGALSRTARRDILCDYYDARIQAECSERIIQPAGPPGLLVAFANNTLHQGGYPAPGGKRRAIVFHGYPAHEPLDYDRLNSTGLECRIAYPTDPAEVF